jgi:ABC-type protease/lipase transport system fused ATPase/permease subunit
MEVSIYVLHPLLGHVALGGALVLFALALLNDRLTHRPLKDANGAAMRAMRSAEAGLRNAEVVDAMVLLPGLTRRWARDNDAVLGLQALASDRAAAVLGLSKFARLFVQVAVLGVGAWRTRRTAG